MWSANDWRVSRGGVGNSLTRPGAGIAFQESATGVLSNSAVIGSFGPGIANFSGQPIELGSSAVTLFDNNPNTIGAFRR